MNDELEPPAVATAHGWTPPDEGARLLTELAKLVRRYVVVTEHQANAVALWLLHTHCIEPADTTPYLHVTSPEKRSGKTRVLELADWLARDPLKSANVTPAALYRLLGEKPRTVLLDETDAVFGPRAREHEDLRALLNAGYRRGAPAYRCVGERGQRVEEFETFGAKALAGIGSLPDTLADRCIPIRLKRRTRNEHVERLRPNRPPDTIAPLVERMRAWADEHADELASARPKLPDELDDRAQDAAEPLLAIADLAGGDWPKRAREALVALRTDADADDETTLRVRVLDACRAAFADTEKPAPNEARPLEKLTTARLLELLNADDEAAWKDWAGGLGMTARALAGTLKPFGVRSHTIRLDDKNTAKGYRRDDFLDAWARYLPQEAVLPSQASHPRPHAGSPDDSETSHDASEASHDEETSHEDPHDQAVVTDVTENHPSGKGGGDEGGLERLDFEAEIERLERKAPDVAIRERWREYDGRSGGAA